MTEVLAIQYDNNTGRITGVVRCTAPAPQRNNQIVTEHISLDLSQYKIVNGVLVAETPIEPQAE